MVKEMLIGAEVENPSLFSSSRFVAFYSTPHTDEFIFFFFLFFFPEKLIFSF